MATIVIALLLLAAPLMWGRTRGAYARWWGRILATGARWVMLHVFAYRFAWKPYRKPVPFATPVRIARRTPLSRWITLELDAGHGLTTGMTRQGKSSAQRVLAAHALQAPDAVLELWDLKGITALRDYQGKAHVLTSSAEIADRIYDLLSREFPGRRDRLINGEQVEARLILVDEAATLIRQLPQAVRDELASLVELGAEYRVFFWFGAQHVLATAVPTKIRSQLSMVIAFRVKSSKESKIVFPSPEDADWTPHVIRNRGDCLVYDLGRDPVIVHAAWLGTDRFRTGVHPSGAVGAPERAPALEKAPLPVRPSVRAEIAAQAPGRTPGRTLTERQDAALTVLDVSGARTPAELSRELGIDRKRAHDVLAQLSARGLVSQRGDGAYALTEGDPS